MKTNRLILAALGSAFSLLLFAAPAQAQATRTWVSGVGDDVNPCSRTAPCKTFAGAISKTAINGEINGLDPGGFGSLTITKSINVDCHDVFCGVVTGSGNGFVVSIAAGNVNDPLRTARVRNVNFHGGGLSGGVGTRLGLTGIRIDNAAQVSIEDCLITDFTLNGIRDQRTTGGRLSVTNTIVRSNNLTGLLSNPSSGSTKIDVAVENLIAEGNSTGVTVANGGVMSISRSMISNNTNNGVDAENATSVMTINDSLISNNGGAGLFTTASGVLRVSNSDIANNAVQQANGAWTSFGNNRITGTAGTAPTAAGAATTDLGQK